MYVFVMTVSWISEHTLCSEIVGVYAHMHQTTTPAMMLKQEGKHVLVTKHAVTGWSPEHPEQLPLQEGAQTDPSVSGGRAAPGALS